MSQQSASSSGSLDKAPAAALRVLDALLIRNPERTAVGAALGFGIHGVLGVFQPLLAGRGVDLGRLDWWASICIGVVFMHLPLIFWSVRHKPLISDELENLIELIESTNIGELEKRAAYRKVVNKCIEEFSLTAKPGAIRSIVVGELEAVHDRTE